MYTWKVTVKTLTTWLQVDNFSRQLQRS